MSRLPLRTGWLVALAVLAAQPADAQVFSLDLEWYRFADPGGANDQGVAGPGDGYETDRGIVNGESAEFSPDGTLIVTTSKADGRRGGYPTGRLTGGTSHLRLWTADGELVWGRPRSPDRDGDGRPDGQPADGEDEIEIAVFTADGNYVAAAGEDDVVEVWRVRDAQTGAVLSEPVLVRTLTEGAAAYDALRFSNDGELLFGGTEERGAIEIWRATGDPAGWVHVGKASHGGARIGQAVNSLDTSSDDRYLVTAGTNEEGGFWRIDVERDADGQAVAVTLDRLATMPQPIRSAKAARFESVTDRHVVIASKDQRMFVYDTERLKRGDATPVTVLHNSLYNGVDGTVGVEIEPGDYSRSGRFLVNGGGPEHNFAPSAAGYRSSFFRVFETAEIQEGAPEPDPVWVQPAFHTEHFHFSPDDGRLATAHEDGTVRLWTVAAGDAVTVASEGFNERTETHDRWTLAGPLATPTDDEWGITAEPARPVVGEPSVVTQDNRWVGHRGSRYLGADNLRGQLHSLTLNRAWDASGFSGLQVQFAIAAARGEFEGDDVLRLVADLDADGAFETALAEFAPDADGDLAWDGRKATPIFQDHFVDLGAALPAGFQGQMRFRIEARTDSGREEVAFDGLRLIGRPGGTGGPVGQRPYGAAPVGLPGQIEAERFDEGGPGVAFQDADGRNRGGAALRDGGVDVFANATASGGHAVGWIEDGEWLEFTVDVAVLGDYTVTARVATPQTGRSFRVAVGDEAASVAVPNTGGWTAWRTVQGGTLALAAGRQVVRLALDDGPFNLDWVGLRAVDAPVVLQAEDAALADGADVRSNHGGFQGGGYANFPQRGGSVTFVGLDGGSGGPATLTLRFAHGGLADRTVQLTINGEASPLTFAPTGAWSEWSTRDVEVTLAPGAENTVRLESTGEDGPNLDALTVTVGTGRAAQILAPSAVTETATAPLAVYPNPSVGRATVAVALEDAADARVDVYDALGRRVVVLADGPLSVGPHRFALDVGALPAGVYVVRLQVGARVEVRTFTVTR